MAWKTEDYEALMARLRREEEEKKYSKLMKPSLTGLGASKLTSGVAGSSVNEADEITFSDISRQLALIFNFLLSIVACSAAVWMVSSHWTAPQRLGLSMCAGIVVAVAEVVVYTGYLRRVQEAKQRDQKKVERKEIVETWVIGKREPEVEKPALPVPSAKQKDKTIRKRNAVK